MANTKRVQLRKGTEAEHSTFTGAQAEVTFDTTKGLLRVHDGLTLSGVEIQKSRLEDLNNAHNGNVLMTNMKYFVNTSSAPFTVSLPSLRYYGDTIHLADSKYTCCYRLLDWLAKPLIIYKSTEKRLEPNA